MPCLQAITTPINTNDLRSIENVQTEMEDTSAHTFEHTLTLEYVPNYMKSLDQDTPDSTYENIEPKNYDGDEEH